MTKKNINIVYFDKNYKKGDLFGVKTPEITQKYLLNSRLIHKKIENFVLKTKFLSLLHDIKDYLLQLWVVAQLHQLKL